MERSSHSSTTCLGITPRCSRSPLYLSGPYWTAPRVPSSPGWTSPWARLSPGRVPDGGGHRLLGRTTATRHRGAGYDHLEVIVDDATRLAYVALVPDESAASAASALLDAAVWFAGHGVRIERVLTDNAWAYTSPTYGRALEAVEARHRRTRAYRPQTNGKAERFIKTLLAEWAYGRLYRSNAERVGALSAWVQHYNTERTHTGIGDITPMEALVNNLHGNHT